MYRQRLRTYKGLLATADMASALRQLEAQASDRGRWLVKYLKPVMKSSPLSLLPAGREVHFQFGKTGATSQEALNAAWGVAVPLGFTPKLRYPQVEPGYQVFYYYGPWQGLHNKLLAEGRGHIAWPSLCCAAQADIGEWKGDKEEARFVQAQLHRIGRNPGPIDGVIGQRTAAAIESLNLPRGSMAVVAEHLRTVEPVKNPSTSGRGHLLIPGRELVVQGYGGVKAWPTQNGAGFEVSGQGRIVVDVR